MGGSVVIDTAVGLVFVFLVVSLAATGLVEYRSKLLDKRGEYLLRGLREMLDIPPSAPSGTSDVNPEVVGEDAGLLGTRPRGERGRTRPLLQTLSKAGKRLGEDLADPRKPNVVPTAALADLVLAHPVVAALHRPLKPGALPPAASTRASKAADAAEEQARSAEAEAAEAARQAAPDEAEKAVAAETARAQANEARKVADATEAGQPVTSNRLTRVGEALWHPVQQRRARQGQMRLASYLSSRTFASALLDLLVPDDQGTTTLTRLRTSLEKLPDGIPGRDALLVLVRQAQGDLATFRTSVEHWYDEQMGRVSGWYKRWAQWRLFTAGAVLAVLFNVNSLAVAQTLFRDEPVRSATVAAALAAEPCAANDKKCRDDRTAVLRDLPLPVGWNLVEARKACTAKSRGKDCLGDAGLALAFLNDELKGEGVPNVLLTLLGWFITAAAVSLGAPFWFDALGKLGSLRTGGKRPQEGGAKANTVQLDAVR